MPELHSAFRNSSHYTASGPASVRLSYPVSLYVCRYLSACKVKVTIRATELSRNRTYPGYQTIRGSFACR